MKATKNPHAIPTGYPPPGGRSMTRKNSRKPAHSPAAKTTVPSPPGRWKPRPSPRAKSRNSTPRTTSSTAASTNEKTPKALTSCVAIRPRLTRCSWYQGSSMVAKSTIAATAARRCSAASARHARRSRRTAPRTTSISPRAPRGSPAACGPCRRSHSSSPQIFSGDRDVLDLGRVAARTAVEAVDEPVDQRPQDEQHLAHQLVDLVAQLGRQKVDHGLQQPDERLQPALGLAGAGRRRGRPAAARHLLAHDPLGRLLGGADAGAQLFHRVGGVWTLGISHR